MLDVSDDALIGFARTLSECVSRNELHEFLIESRSLPKQTSRDELRRQCPHAGAWILLIKDRLANRETRPQGLRALSLLAQAYASRDSLDDRIETGVKKARQAAERGDPARVTREFIKLRDYAAELRDRELEQPELLLYLSAGSDRARDCVAGALGAALSAERTQPQKGMVADSVKAANPLPVVASKIQTVPVQASLPVRAKTPEPLLDPTVSRLRVAIERLMSANSAAPDWKLPQLLNVRHAPLQVRWPEVGPATQKAKELAHRLNGFSTSVESAPSTINGLASIRAALSSANNLLTNELSNLEHEIAQAASAIGTAIEASLSAMQPELSAEVTTLRDKITGQSWTESDVDSLIAANTKVTQEKITKVMAYITQLQGLAAYMSPDEQRSLENKARHLAMQLRPDQLQKLVSETEVRTEESRRSDARVRQAGQTALSILSAGPRYAVPEELSSAVTRAVGAGDETLIAELLNTAPKVRAVAASIAIRPQDKEKDVQIAQPRTILYHEPFEAEISKFVPRDRISASDPMLPRDANELIQFLLDRALMSIEAGSVAGALDHALDVLLLADHAKKGRDHWSSVGLTVIAALPTMPVAASNWGERVASDLQRSLNHLDGSTTTNYVSALLTQPNFDEAISERLVQAEVAPFAEQLAKAMHDAAGGIRHYLLEDIARAVGAGAAYGDPTTAKQLLIELARPNCSADVVAHIGKWLDNERAHGISGQKAKVPPYMVEGIKSFHASNKVTPQPRPAGRSTALRLQVPPSVARSGGFGFNSGSDEVEFALLVSNQQNGPLTSVEILIPAVRNPWLQSDIIRPLGSIAANARHLTVFTGRLSAELSTARSFELGVQVRYRNPGQAASKFEDTRPELRFTDSRSSEIKNYEGAAGKPLLLFGDTLRYSSSSVKRALTDISAGLKARGMAALVIGRRRRGKTSILQTLAQLSETRENYTVITDAWEDLPSRNLSQTLRHLGSIFDRAARTLGADIESLEQRLALDVKPGWNIIQNWLTDLSGTLESPARLLLLVDEFQKWITSLDEEARTRILYILRGLFNRPEGGMLSISIVLFGLSNIRDFTRASADFENAFRIFSIESFTLAEADALIRSNESIEFDSRAVIRVRDLAGGNPFLINLLCNDIASRLRDVGRAYCLPDDVERVVQGQIEDRENSRVWSFLQYLLKEGEEDHAAEIEELPTLLALAYARKARGVGRSFIDVDEILAELKNAEVACDSPTLERHLASAVKDELVTQRGERYGFANGWLAEWLGLREDLLPIRPEPDQDLVLGRFRLGRFVERGGQASVYEAQDTRASNRLVIVKIYPRTQPAGMSPGVIQEAKLLHSIEHTAVVQCIEFGSDPEKGDVIVLERVKGESLRELLMKMPPHAHDLIGPQGDLRIQAKFIEQIAAAISECHRVGIVHKDLKPENIMVQSSAGMWLPKIIDFGLATNISELGSEVLRTVGSYTPGYVAPERYRGEGRRAPADIYSLGVITYELLTGDPPFPLDPYQARELQETGTFKDPKESRPEIPIGLAEIIKEMLSPDPAARPNAFTLVGRLTASLDDRDWKAYFESGKKAYLEADAESAFNYFERAVFGAPEEGRKTEEYLEALSLLVDLADETGRILSTAAEILQPLITATIMHQKVQPTFETFLSKLLQAPATEELKRTNQRTAIHMLVELLCDISPSAPLMKGVTALLKSPEHPAVWQDREDIYLLALDYLNANLVDQSVLGNWCLKATAKLRQREANMVAAQTWLRRAERIGIASSTEYRAESERLQKVIRQTTTPSTLPRITMQSSASCAVGEDERGHLNVARILKWVDRLLKLHPYVQEVRRVKKDPGIPITPTRLLPLENIGQHLLPGNPLDHSRIIPAVLDESYCSPKGTTALRINIILPEGTTIDQREAVIGLLKEDSSLFGFA